ncbi:MAG TPA: LamG domain-containing protein, partial [Polyangium sp.]|nr:LamG domain-containing protein [Polyangium sp.]
MSIAAPFFYLQDSLNNNGSISDQSRHARSIRMSGIQEDRDAEFGSCFRISSDAYFEATCPGPASFTLALWVRSLLIEEAPGQTRTLIQLGSHNARLCTKDLKPSFAELALATQKLDRDVWQHLAVSFDATSQMCIVYLDGARIANTSTTLDTTGDILRIGMGSNTNDRGFEGKIAHVLLYDRALSDDDIQEVMWATEKNIEPVLLLRDTTRLAEKIVKDDSGHGILCNADGVTAVNDAERGLCYELSNGYVAADAQICPSSFTLSAWVKQHDTATETFYPLIEFGEDAPGLQIKNSKLSLIGGASSTVDFPKGVWKHVAVTYNPISQRTVLFVDGIQVGTAIGAIDTTGAGLLIGTGWREEDPLFAGLMAHVAIHDAPLSARDIEDLRAFSAIRAHLHLPLDVKDATGRTPDASSRSAAALCNGPVAVSDNKFGTAIYFDGVDDFIDVSSLNCPVSFTFAAYICPDAIACRREVPILEFGRGEPFFWLSYGRLKVHSGPTVDVDHALTPDTWAHVVATYDAPMHTISLYIDGELVASGDFSGSAGGIGLGIGHRYSANWFRGRMRHVMVYDHAFSKDLIRQIIAHTSPPTSKIPRPLTRPGVGLFSMDLINDAEQPVLYLEQTQQLSLSIENTWGGDIQLVATNNPVGPDCFHFQMQFRQGTLNPTFRDELIAGTGETISNLRTLGWSLHCQDLDTGGDLISLLWTGGSSSTPIAGLIKSK